MTHIRITNAWVRLTTHLSTPRGWMAKLATLADIQRTVYPEEVTSQLHVMTQARESSPVTDWCSNHCATPPTKFITYSDLNYLSYGNDDDTFYEILVFNIYLTISWLVTNLCGIKRKWNRTTLKSDWHSGYEIQTHHHSLQTPAECISR